MAQDAKPTQAPLLCATGCGFYGNPRTNGMCSVCYKDSLQRHNSSSRVSEPVLTNLDSVEVSPSTQSPPVSPDPVREEDSPGPVTAAAVPQAEPALGTSQTQLKTEDVAASELDISVEPSTADLEKSKPKRNRCFTCNKKVGLTGFDCRCGNLFCGVHRYSDVHNCTFDYKADAAQKIRKENPVIVGEKIKKI
ncbi:AN1-type zinc finger protein 6 [Brachyhypopomus gauderio]|uniref:AN1-type zinc finger protein 6 n=1 Tax=Brachyhypopomus gauderio TaxID=698409 RepID=UPI0040410F4F